MTTDRDEAIYWLGYRAALREVAGCYERNAAQLAGDDDSPAKSMIATAAAEHAEATARVVRSFGALSIGAVKACHADADNVRAEIAALDGENAEAAS